MTDPNDTPALDLDAIEREAVAAPNTGLENVRFVSGARANVLALVARVRADAARIAALEAACLDLRRALDGAEEMAARESESIAALEAERDACERARSDHAERVVELNKACNYLERVSLDAAQRVEATEAERDAALARVRELEAAALTVADAVRAEERERCAWLEAIIAGRAQPPTSEEITRHYAKAQGDWLRHSDDGTTLIVGDEAYDIASDDRDSGRDDVRWIALTWHGAPCEWPVTP